jgi:GT2 family glycosyltransferase
MNVGLSIVVVLYKEDLEQSSSIQSVRSISGSIEFELFAWDNSPTAQTKHQIGDLQRVIPRLKYIHTPENVSMARIYNQVTRWMDDKSEFLLLLDQDSIFSVEFLQKGFEAIRANPNLNLFVPYIKVEEQIFSPGHYSFIKGKYWKSLSLGVIEAKNTVAVSSGMLIRKSYLLMNYPAFDERLRLYGIDSDFLINFARRNKFLFVLDYGLGHNLSVTADEKVTQKLFRFRDLCYSLKIIARKKSGFHFVVAAIYLAYLRTKLAIQYRTIEFLF